MSSYASKTSVPVDRSRAELERLLARYGATGFGFLSKGARRMVTFELTDRTVRLFVDLPLNTDPEIRYMANGRNRSEAQIEAVLGQVERQRWRALVLVVKAKLEAVASGISTVEEEFLAWTVLPDQSTVMEQLGPRIQEAIAAGSMPTLALPAPPGDRR